LSCRSLSLPSWQAHENFVFAKEELLDGISIVLAFLIASHLGGLNLSILGGVKKIKPR
jgi:hypothetical protein